MQKPKKAEHNDIPDLVSTCHIQCTAKIPRPHWDHDI